jgi:hypothetical protein
VSRYRQSGWLDERRRNRIIVFSLTAAGLRVGLGGG